MAIILDDVPSGYNLDKIQDNFDRIEAYLNDKVLKRNVDYGEDNIMKVHLDMNGNRIVNTSRVISAETMDAALAYLEGIGYDTGA